MSDTTIDAAGEDRLLDARPAIPGETRSRVALTGRAIDLLRVLVGRVGPVMFHQSGGCCDGSAPMCYPAGDFVTGDADVLLGVFDLDSGTGNETTPIEFWMSRAQFAYWEHTRLTVDLVDGRGSGFSLEAPEGKRFLIRSELIAD